MRPLCNSMGRRRTRRLNHPWIAAALLSQPPGLHPLSEFQNATSPVKSLLIGRPRHQTGPTFSVKQDSAISCRDHLRQTVATANQKSTGILSLLTFIQPVTSAKQKRRHFRITAHKSPHIIRGKITLAFAKQNKAKFKTPAG